jgi:MoxR-like ATPase
MDLASVQAVSAQLSAQFRRVVIGQDHVVDLLLLALLSEGHVLMEGVPGTAKTLMAQTFAASLALDFKRIQFTPDLMPGDLIGTNLFNFQTNQFVLTKGPLFTQVLLADEINRTPPKTQAALLQAMQERAVTIDGTTYGLGGGFMVLATQNPIEQEGTYPLPEAQLDRFLFKVLVDYPGLQEEREMVRLHGHRTATPDIAELGLERLAGLQDVAQMREVVRAIRLSDPLVDYVVDIVRATRKHTALLYGASPRAANMLASASRARAALSGRDFVIPDDVQELVLPVLRHRVVLSPAAEIEGVRPDQVLSELVAALPAPR